MIINMDEIYGSRLDHLMFVKSIGIMFALQNLNRKFGYNQCPLSLRGQPMSGINIQSYKIVQHCSQILKQKSYVRYASSFNNFTTVWRLEFQ